MAGHVLAWTLIVTGCQMTRDSQVFAVIQKYDGRAFHYGADCCQFAGEVVEILTGANPMDQFEYSTKVEAKSILSSLGGLKDAVIQVLGAPKRTRPIMSGDVAMVRLSTGLAAAVAYKNKLVVRTPTGVTDYQLERALCSWEVD